MQKIKHIQNLIKQSGGYITEEQAQRYITLVCKIRTDEEEQEKRSIIVNALEQENTEDQ